MRAVDVVTAYDDDGELERLPVAVHEHLCGGFAGGVGIGWGEQRALCAVGAAGGNFAVDFVGTDVDEAFQSAAVLGAV